MLFHLYRVSYGKKETPPEQREYRVREFEQAYGRSPVGSIKEITDFIQTRLQMKEFVLELYDSVSEPDKNRRVEFPNRTRPEQGNEAPH